ncbi:nicotinamide riboside transporter PnuC, partial [Klebsiella pneumoniae]|nr:nicotinamide riboside transporter PnuC [Klebsiella pneumoniae]
LLGLANVILIVRRSVWNYPFGLLMVAMYAVVFWEARLYSDALLQVFFFTVQLVGVYQWLDAREHDGRVGIAVLSDRGRI